MHFSPATLLLFALGLQRLQSAEWCHAPVGSCVGERRSLEKKSFPTGLHGVETRGSQTDLVHFADWDGDGDADILVGTYYPDSTTFRILFHERLSSNSFQVHELMKIPDIYQQRGEDQWTRDQYLKPSFSFQVADWDGDEKLDLLLCTRVMNLSFYNHSGVIIPTIDLTASWITFLSHRLLPLNSLEKGIVILNREANQLERSASRQCDMKPVDWDEDGDLDLFLGHRYFERRSANLTDLVERAHPLEWYGEWGVLRNGFDSLSVVQIVDFDGDGHLELIVDTSPISRKYSYRRLASLRRALDGSFVQSAENPFTDVKVESRGDFFVHVLDWNSDGLPDILVVSEDSVGDLIWLENKFGWHHWRLVRYYEQVQNRDMGHDFHLNVFERIVPATYTYPIVVDWNQDGVDDHVIEANYFLPSSTKIYEMRGLDVQEVPLESLGFDDIDHLGNVFALVDWDGDGDLDIMSSGYWTLRYFERVSGRFKAEQFPSIEVRPYKIFFIPVDWDQDGDVDLVIGDGRYYEHLADGSLKLWEQNIFTPFLGSTEGQCLDAGRCALRFLDCDADGDLDLLRVEGTRDPPVQVCEHDSGAGTLTCGHDFLCLGTNLSNFRPSQVDAFKQFGTLHHLDLVNVSDGRLKFIAFHWDGFKAVLWTAGFCTSEAACHDKGYCEKKHLQCTCGPGHELGDCSQCQRDFHGVLEKVGQIRNCKACPARNGKVCDGRGDCFDDAAAQALAAPAQGPAVAFMATGNGSCRCYEAHFNGSDIDGRSTCAGGICPAGSEEQDGTCRQCEEGSFSLAGGRCTKCGSGSYSLAASSSCLECEPGKISKSPGAAKCDACPAGKYEIEHQSCSDCPAGFFSSRGNSLCTKCPAGSIAPTTGSSTCEPCPASFYSEEGAPTCIPCRPGTVSSAASGSCIQCDAGSFAKDSTCELCPSGTFALPGSSACHKCLRGRYSLTGSGSCVRCLPGTVSDSDGASTCTLCPPGTEEFERKSCTPCRSGFKSSGGNSSCTKCRAGFSAPETGSSLCEPCPGGFYSEEGAPSCIQCPPGTVSSEASGSCDSCEGNFLRAVPDATKQSCEVDSIQVLLLAASAFTSTGFCFLCLIGFLGKAPIADVSAQGQKVVMTTTLSHFLLKGSQVIFTGTENPNLDGQSWTVQALNSFQLTLHVEGNQLDQLDTSMGRFRIKCPGPFIRTGLWRCPLVFWCLLFGAASGGAMSQLTWFLRLLMASFGVFAGSLAFAWRFRQGQRTPLSKRRRQFLKEWPLPRQPCERGPDRSMTAGQLHDFVQFFEAFIKERSMYYVCSNIVKPLTEPSQLSFVELIGPTEMKWFVSHYWGMAVRHFNDAIRKHAMSYASEWRGLAYWICTFSISQWKVEGEVGNGTWQESSFYLALRSPSCKGTAMVIDEHVLPLQRIWCLFEVYHTILLSQNAHFQGLLLCTSTGVLQEGRAGTDVAVRVAERARDLDTRSAGASKEADLQMIHALIERMEGGFDAMNDFVRETICRALEASHEHYEQTFRGLIGDLTSRVAAARGPLPTLLSPSVSREADFVSPKGQVDPTDDVYPLP